MLERSGTDWASLRREAEGPKTEGRLAARVRSGRVARVERVERVRSCIVFAFGVCEFLFVWFFLGVVRSCWVFW